MLIHWLKGDQLCLFPKTYFYSWRPTSSLIHIIQKQLFWTLPTRKPVFFCYGAYDAYYICCIWVANAKEMALEFFFLGIHLLLITTICFFILGNFKIFLSHPKAMRVLCNSLHYIATAAPVFSCQYGIVLTLYREALLQNWWALRRRGRQRLVLLFYCLFL